MFKVAQLTREESATLPRREDLHITCDKTVVVLHSLDEERSRAFFESLLKLATEDRAFDLEVVPR